MVGYTALLITLLDEGMACVILQNGGGDKRGVTGAALAAVRAGLAGDELPSPWAPPAATAIPGDDFVGTYAGEDGRTLEVRKDEEGLSMSIGSVSARLERDPLVADPGDSFLAAHPAFDRFLLEFGRDEGGRVVEAYHGSTWFRGEAYGGPDPEEPRAGWDRHPGIYRNDDPWSAVLRVVLRKGRLAILWPTDASDEEGGELIPLDDGSFAVGDPAVPLRVHFEGDVRGMTAVVVCNGGRWFRSFEE
jgi:hypothetical protein